MEQLILNDQLELLMNRVHQLHQLLIVHIYLRVRQMDLLRGQRLPCRSEVLKVVLVFLELGGRKLKVPTAV